MKFLRVLSVLGIMSTSQVYASYEVIGWTKECPLKTEVILKTVKGQSSVLVLLEKEIYQLAPVGQRGSMRMFASEGIISFEATIMGPEMARLSELTIYLSGVKLECLIDP